eukprot:scaffold3717_cov124-Isochrysis_galbana.AAC.13
MRWTLPGPSIVIRTMFRRKAPGSGRGAARRAPPVQVATSPSRARPPHARLSLRVPKAWLGRSIKWAHMHGTCARGAWHALLARLLVARLA